MAFRGYILIETEVGQARLVAEAVEGILEERYHPQVDMVTGPYDVVIHLEADDLYCLGDCSNKVKRLPGVRRTTTCLAIRIA